MSAGPLGDVVKGQPAALEVLQEGRHQTRERVDPPLSVESREHLLARDRREGHAVGHELLRQASDQPAFGLFVAEGFDQDGATLGMDAALPLHFPPILLPIDEWRRVPCSVDPEVFDIDAVFGKMEVGLVLALLGGRQVVLIRRLVLVRDAVEIKSVRDLAFLEAADGLAFQRADVELADVVVVLAPVSEVFLAPVRSEPLLEPLIQRGREVMVGEQIGHDTLEQVEQCPVVLGRRGERRALPLGFADDRHAEAVEGAHRHVARDRGAEAFAHPLFHLPAGIAREGQQKQLGRLAIALSDKPSRLGHDDRGLAAAGRGDNEVPTLVDDDRPALLLRERAGLDPVEEVARTGQLVDDERLVGPRRGIARRVQKPQNVPQHSDFGSIRQRFRPPRCEPAGNCPRLDLKVGTCVGGEVFGRIAQCFQPVMHGLERFESRRKRTAPPLRPCRLHRVRQRPGPGPRQAGHGCGPRRMTEPQASPAQTHLCLDCLDIAQGDFGRARPKGESDAIRIHRCRLRLSWTQHREQQRRQSGPFDVQPGSVTFRDKLAASRPEMEAMDDSNHSR